MTGVREMLDGFTKAGEELFAFVLVESRCLDPPWLLTRMHDTWRSFGGGIIPLKPAPVSELTQRINQAPEIKRKQVFHPAPTLVGHALSPPPQPVLQGKPSRPRCHHHDPHPLPVLRLVFHCL